MDRKKKNGGDVHALRRPQTRTLTEKQRQQLSAFNKEVTHGFAKLGVLAKKRRAIAKSLQDVDAEIAEADAAVDKAEERRTSQLHAAAMAIDIDIVKDDWSYDWEKGVFHPGRAPGAIPIMTRESITLTPPQTAPQPRPAPTPSTNGAAPPPANETPPQA